MLVDVTASGVPPSGLIQDVGPPAALQSRLPASDHLSPPLPPLRPSAPSPIVTGGRRGCSQLRIRGPRGSPGLCAWYSDLAGFLTPALALGFLPVGQTGQDGVKAPLSADELKGRLLHSSPPPNPMSELHHSPEQLRADCAPATFIDPSLSRWIPKSLVSSPQ